MLQQLHACMQRRRWLHAREHPAGRAVMLQQGVAPTGAAAASLPVDSLKGFLFAFAWQARRVNTRCGTDWRPAVGPHHGTTCTPSRLASPSPSLWRPRPAYRHSCMHDHVHARMHDSDHDARALWAAPHLVGASVSGSGVLSHLTPHTWRDHAPATAYIAAKIICMAAPMVPLSQADPPTGA